MQRLILYSTQHCHLCEQALDLLLSQPGLRGVQLDVIDVASTDALMERYGPRIPVLRLGDRELDAPFDRDDLARFLIV